MPAPTATEPASPGPAGGAPGAEGPTGTTSGPDPDEQAPGLEERGRPPLALPAGGTDPDRRSPRLGGAVPGGAPARSGEALVQGSPETGASPTEPSRAVSGRSLAGQGAAPEPSSPPAGGGRSPAAAPVPDTRGAAPGPDGSQPGGSPATPEVYTTDELAAAAGCEADLVDQLRQYGLLTPNATVRGVAYFDPEALALARTAASFAELGVEPRHLRAWRTAVDRELSLFEQLVVPLLRQRNPQARKQAAETLGRLSQLGADLREELLREGLGRIR